MVQFLKDPKPAPPNTSHITRKMGSSTPMIPHGTDAYQPSNDTNLFSCSLPVLPHDNNLNFTDSEHSGKSTTDHSLPSLNNLNLEDEVKDLLEDIEPNGLGPLLPDDEDELLAGIMDDFDLSNLLEDFDLFGSGGGFEMDFDALENPSNVMPNLNLSDSMAGNGIGHFAVAGEHPYGEHPSRTLFVRNINSNVEDSELRFLFEQYGDIRTLYTACKHRGFVMISYYDIRAARVAMRALQNKPLRRRKLDIHFSIPKDNPSEKDINQGTLVVFNLDSSVSNEELRNIFGVHGEIKEIRETPHKRHHKFIEFYDVRGAESALRTLNGIDIGGKRIKLEPSRPGGARRNLMQQLSQELDHDETRSLRHQFGSPVEHNSFHTLSRSPILGSLSPTNKSYISGLASILPSHMSNSAKIAPIGKDQGRVNFSNRVFSGSNGSHSFPNQKFGSSPGTISPFGEPKSDSFGSGTLSGPQFLWGSPTLYSESASSSAWSKPAMPTNQRGSLIGQHHQHHVGSAPSGVHLDRQFGYFQESPETSFRSPSSFGNMGLGHSNGSYMMNIGPGFGLPGNMSENGSGHRMMPLRRPVFLGNGSYPGPPSIGSEGFDDHSRRRVETNQFQLDLDKIISGEDNRTTLMIKNIPNKYTSKMLLAAIDEGHSGTYDFLYLPIDFKNKCNVGYAFINMLSPAHIIPFYKAFNGKKWEKFNSEKVASLAYARIQGKNSLVTHFQNSSLMNEDKQCRPILFHSKGQEAASVEETLLSGNLNICIRQPDGSYSGETS